MKANVDVYGLFDAVVCAKEVGCGKDHPDIYLEAARRISAKPGELHGLRGPPPGDLLRKASGNAHLCRPEQQPPPERT
jgi:hypothetical protein